MRTQDPILLKFSTYVAELLICALKERVEVVLEVNSTERTAIIFLVSPNGLHYRPLQLHFLTGPRISSETFTDYNLMQVDRWISSR